MRDTPLKSAMLLLATVVTLAVSATTAHACSCMTHTSFLESAQSKEATVARVSVKTQEQTGENFGDMKIATTLIIEEILKGKMDKGHKTVEDARGFGSSCTAFIGSFKSGAELLVILSQSTSGAPLVAHHACSNGVLPLEKGKLRLQQGGKTKELTLKQFKALINKPQPKQPTPKKK